MSWFQGVLEARGGVEPPIKVLPTFAFTLGDRAFVTMWFDCPSYIGALQFENSNLRRQGALRLNNAVNKDNRVKSVGNLFWFMQAGSHGGSAARFEFLQKVICLAYSSALMPKARIRRYK